MSKIIASGAFAALLAHSWLVPAPSIGSATVRLALALVLLCTLIPVVRDWLEEVTER